MNKKITLQDITESLMQKHSMDRKDAEAFVKGMFDLIEDSLATEKLVKIKGLGTFKLIDVDSRESINVNSGERFRIEGHSKISFIPDATLKNIINKPFSHFETVILNEGTNLEDTETVEENPSNIISDESSEDLQENIIAPSAESGVDNEAEEQTQQPEVENIIEEPEAEEKQEEISTQTLTNTSEEVQEYLQRSTEVLPNTTEEVSTETEVDVEDILENNAEVAQDVISDEVEAIESVDENDSDISDESISINDKYKDIDTIVPQTESSIEESKSIDNKDKKWNIVIYIAILLIIAFACYLFYNLFYSSSEPTKITDPVVIEESTTNILPAANDSISDSSYVAPLATKDTINKIDSLKEQKRVEVVQKTETVNSKPKEEKEVAVSSKVYDENKNYTISGLKTTHTLKEGETIMRVALKYYGSKKFYKYILDYNKETLGEDGNKVRIGTKIKVPELKLVN